MLLGSVILASILATAATAAPPAPVAEIEITGRVLDARGKPAAKVPVTLAAAHHDAAAMAETVTDADGRFRLVAPDVGMYEVRVMASGLLPMTAALHPCCCRWICRRCGWKRAIHSGSVSSTRTAPRLDARAIGWPNLPAKAVDGWSIAPRAGAADAEGRIVLPRRRGEVLDVAAIAPGLPEVQARRVPGAALDLRADRTCSRLLRVRDAAGALVAGAAVTSERFVLGATDAAGELTIAAPCSRPITVMAESSASAARARLDLAPAARPRRWS